MFIQQSLFSNPFNELPNLRNNTSDTQNPTILEAIRDMTSIPGRTIYNRTNSIYVSVYQRTGVLSLNYWPLAALPILQQQIYKKADTL